MTAWSRVLPPVEGGGPGCSAAGERRNFFGMLGLGPPALRSARCGPCPAARPPLRACSRPGPLRPPRPRWPRLGPPSLPLGRCGGRCGLSAGRLRPSARSRCSPGGPRCGVGGSGRGRACLAPASAPGVGVRAVLPARRCGLAAGVLALGLLRAALRPVRAAPVPPPRAPVGRPGYRHGPPRLPPSGGRWGRPAAALCRAAPPSVGVSDRAAAVKGPARRPRAALDRLPRPDLRTARGGAVGPGS